MRFPCGRDAIFSCFSIRIRDIGVDRAPGLFLLRGLCYPRVAALATTILAAAPTSEILAARTILIDAT
jgi:hypothetical protein